MKYRKKPVIIEAMEWTGKNLKEIIEFSGLHESAAVWLGQNMKKLLKQMG